MQVVHLIGVVTETQIAETRLGDAIRCAHGSEERCRHYRFSSLCRKANLQAFVSGSSVLFPLRIGIHGAAETERRRGALIFPTDREHLDPVAIQSNIHLVSLTQATDHAV